MEKARLEVGTGEHLPQAMRCAVKINALCNKLIIVSYLIHGQQ